MRRYIGDPDNFSKELSYTSSRISIHFSTYSNNINYDLERYFYYSKQEIDKFEYDANIEGGTPLEAFKNAEIVHIQEELILVELIDILIVLEK